LAPRHCQAPPAKLKPGTNLPYPTLIIEEVYGDESFKGLKADARKKAFARSTTIQHQHHIQSTEWLHFLGRPATQLASNVNLPIEVLRLAITDLLEVL
jgi:hypothetical protein